MSLIEQPQAAPAADQQVVAPGLGDQPVIQGGTDAPPQQTDAEARARQLGWVPQEEFRGDPSRWRSAEEYVERGYNEPSIARATIERLQSRIETQEREFGHRLRSIERMSDVALSRQKQQLTASFDQRIREAASVGDMAAFDRLNTEKVQAVREHDLEVADQRWRQPKQQAPQGGGLSSSDQAAVDEWAASNKWVTTNQEMATLADMVSKRLARERPGLTAHQNLAEVTREVRRRYPEAFAAQHAAPNGSPVEGGSRVPLGRSSAASRLPPEAVAQAQKYIKQGLIKSLDEYAASYNDHQRG